MKKLVQSPNVLLSVYYCQEYYSMENPDVKPVPSTQLALPLPAIICIAIGAYIVLIVIILLIRQLLLQRGMCAHGQCCGKEGDPCCECCIVCSESLNCCRSPNIEACLDSCCPARRQMDCVDIIMCQCCNDPNNQCCGQQCDCGNCDCTCNCQSPECSTINCCCFQINTHQMTGLDYDRTTGISDYPPPPNLSRGYPLERPYPEGYPYYGSYPPLGGNPPITSYPLPRGDEFPSRTADNQPKELATSANPGSSSGGRLLPERY